MDALDEWLGTEVRPNVEEEKRLLALRERLREKVEFWNEATLSFYFLGPLMAMVDFDDTEYYSSFVQTPLSMPLNGDNIKGNVDFLVATGYQKPKSPFFVLHEYKPEESSRLDPTGQLMIAMLSARRENEQRGLDLPIYGTYVLGRFWFFLLLRGSDYAKSLAYDATQDDLFRIFAILKQVKININRHFNIPTT